ncbi:hypothetical protein ACWD4T_14410 [Streptomyces umbrinus]
METVGWATATVAVLGGVVLVAGYILDQIPALSAKAERAITALRRVQAAWRDSEEAQQREVPVPDDKVERPRSR